MCSRKAFSSRELFAKTGMNSSELACNTARKSQASDRLVLLPCRTDAHSQSVTRQTQHSTGWQLQQESGPGSSSLSLGLPVHQDRASHYTQNIRPAPQGAQEHSLAAKLLLNSNNTRPAHTVPFFLPASLHCPLMAGNQCKGSSATPWSP